jgi:hypothetical protein
MMFTFLLLSSLTACGKKDRDNADPASSQKPVEAKPEWKKLGNLGIEAEVPSDARVEDNTAGAGFPSATIYATPTVFVSGAGDMSDLKPTLDATKAQLAKDPNKLDSWTKSDTTADGWILEGTRTSMSGNKLYTVSVRRTLGGKPFDCGTNAQSEAERDTAKKLCQSLRAAK